VAHYDGLVGLAAAFGSHLSWNDRNLVTVTSDGTVRQLLYNPNRPRMERVIDANNGVISVAMDQNHFFTASSDGRLRDILFANGQVKELGVIPGIDRVAADGFDWSNLVYSLKVGSVHKYLWQLAPLPPSPAMPPVAPVAPVATVAKEATFTFYLRRQPVWDGPVPYAAVFPELPIVGNVVRIANPNAFTIDIVKGGHSTTECFTNPSSAVRLSPKGSTTSKDLQDIYSSASPSLPVSVSACIENGANVPDLVPLTVTYTYK
ncbi:MAG TPA: hypothetical protein VIK52_06870, partial [Opitutaceae bacterium]